MPKEFGRKLPPDVRAELRVSSPGRPIAECYGKV